MCHDEEEAENLTQNLFLRLWAKRDRLKRVDNISSYVFTMAYNESINFIRHSLTLTTLPIDSNVKEIGGGADPQRDVEYKELIRKVYDKIGISQRTVEAHISASLKELRKLIPLLFIFGLCR